MTWTARGDIYGLEEQTLVWDDGPLNWPDIILALAADEAAAGVDVVITAPSITRRLNLDDETAVSAWLAGQRMALTGDLPAGIPGPPAPEGIVY